MCAIVFFCSHMLHGGVSGKRGGQLNLTDSFWMRGASDEKLFSILVLELTLLQAGCGDKPGAEFVGK
ncbi:hypothetical protein A7P96_02235 [Eikenella sp. NML03-A-027]|nr:hypothetical protein A7P96_02235 [Eikenella sp. NML03-A-027]